MTGAQETDYEAEAGAVLNLVVSVMGGDPDVSCLSLLHVGCGSGKHAAHLTRWFGPITAVDSNPERLMEGLELLPLMNFVGADIRTMRLVTPGFLGYDPILYDVVLCLSGAIGHLETIVELRQAIGQMVWHLKSTGLIIIEPNLTFFSQEQFGEIMLDAGLQLTYNPEGLSLHGHGVYYGTPSHD